MFDGDLIRSRRCDCGHQLDAALQAIVAEEVGVLIYMRGHEGRVASDSVASCLHMLYRRLDATPLKPTYGWAFP
ncbi:hypothetical protein FXW78_24745 [Rhodococcus opacus]|nr:hypothetical protein [Rhodococcus opacus]